MLSVTRESNAIRRRKSYAMPVVGAIGAAALVLSGCGAVQGGTGSAEEDYPTRELTLTVPFAPGGSSDLTGRALSQALEEPLGQSVVVENKEGANGAVGTDEALNAAPDGYQLLFSSQSLFSVTPLFVEDATAVTLDDMEIVAPLTEEGYVLVTSTESEYEDLDSLIEAERVRFATSGVGSGSQFAPTALFAIAGANAEDVPHDGGNPAVTSLLGGHTDATTVQIAEAMPRIEDGSFRPLAVFSEERNVNLPDVPTAKELGYDLNVSQRRWLAVPAETPDEVVTTLADAVAEAKASDEFQQFLEDNYIDNWDAEPADVQEIVATDSERYRAIAEEHGIGLAGE
ncbi:tripartite tricarboxylate transporter substrate binding protein [Brevibacterium daeguense]|uniref:Tripartite tricarboxylate transporter substrate binding protein n=1 Tax=Brevibacterium daeguense TaxID=909936 RepID=A0ABP8EFJ5_9MICO|nr:tripartite tricarboxylate transporter substrate binding protein [Brevibacterium daeguense]